MGGTARQLVCCFQLVSAGSSDLQPLAGHSRLVSARRSVPVQWKERRMRGNVRAQPMYGAAAEVIIGLMIVPGTFGRISDWHCGGNFLNTAGAVEVHVVPVAK
jgi:hypothetical protein